MKKLFPFVFVALYLIFSAPARAEVAGDRFYAGGAIGFATLKNWSRDNVDNYYGTQGYMADQASGWLNIGDSLYEHFWKELMVEGNIIGGFRLASFVNVEAGYSRGDNTFKQGYKNLITGKYVWSERDFSAHSTYLAASLHPFPRWAHGVYLKFGRHYSHLDIAKKVTGNDPNLVALSAGDSLYGDGNNKGYGSIMALGWDIATTYHGAVRVEYSRWNHFAGTQFARSAFVLGYVANF